MEPVIAKSVYNTLHSLSHPLAPYLNENLSKAKGVDDQSLEKHMISLNSVVEFVYEPGTHPIKMQIVLPEHEDPGKRKISVLAPISRALLGFKESDIVAAKMPSGEKKLRILRVHN